MKKNNNCIDCRKLIYSCAKRCCVCAGKYRYKLGLTKLNKGTGKGKISLHWKGGLPKCKDCGKELKDYRSKKCHSCAKKGNTNTKNKKWAKKHYCIDCKKEITFGSKLGRCQSCEIKRRYKLGILNAKGNKNGNWQGGKQQKLRPRNTKKYINWRNKVFKRDNYTCQNCGQIGGKLEAHHKKSWKNYSKLRYKINNGLTLCYKCHHTKRKENDLSK